MYKYILVVGFYFTSIFLRGQETEGLVARFSFNSGGPEADFGKFDTKSYDIFLCPDRFDNPAMAYYFHGHRSSFLKLGTSSLLKPKHGTISLWVNIHGIMGLGKGVDTNPFLVTGSHKGDDCNQAYYIGFDINTRRMNGSVTNSCLKGATVYSQKAVAMGKWYHIVFAYDDSFIWLYLDGALQHKLEKKFETHFLNGDSVVVGNLSSRKNTRFFLGSIDDIEIYNRVLAENEVLELYNAPNPNKSKILLGWISLATVILLVIFILFLLVRYRIRILLNREKDKNRLRNHWYEQENRVLTAQMDPHFIFNSLNTIQQFIIVNENEKAQLYLSKFSRLMRKILESNAKETISLREEMEIMEKYLEIESLRFNNVFDYKISYNAGLDPAQVFIPHFLIQPLVENAIWHGLLPKQGNKQLLIAFEKTDDKTLICVIEDNGVGRKTRKISEIDDKKSSFAISFIEQRLLLMSKMYGKLYRIEIIDLKNAENEAAGTRVNITIPISDK